MRCLIPGCACLLLVSTVTTAADYGAVQIPGGRFEMGTERASIEALRERYGLGWPGVFENEAPARPVTLSPFSMDATEVTNDQFQSFVADHPAWTRERVAREQHNGDYLAHWVDGAPPADRGDHPVVNVTWGAAQAYCRSVGGRLPTEAEWEYAARAADDREFPWGDASPDAALANYSATGVGRTMPVASYPPNDAGLYDMAGNVWEWLLDPWEDAHAAAAATNPGSDAPGTTTGPDERRAVRGASFDGSVANLRTRWRDSHLVSNATGFVGFRCAYPGAGASDAESADVDALTALDQAYADTWKAGDADAVMALFTDDATLVPHHGDAPIKGAEAIRDFWFDPSYPPTVIREWTRRAHEIVVVGDMGVVRGRARLTWEYDGRRTTIPDGNYVLIAVRSGEQWRIRMLTWNDDPRDWTSETLD